MKNRSTSDLIVVFLAGVVGLVVLISSVGMILVQIFSPEIDIGVAAGRITALTSNLIALIVGYLAGVKRANGNGGNNGHKGNDL